MKLTRPFPRASMSQGFAQNLNPLYASQGLQGHTGEDYDVAYDSPIPCAADNSYCYSTLNKDNPDLGKYRAVFTLIEPEGSKYAYEVSYGHPNKILAVVGRMYHTGDILATVGNAGSVFQGGKEVSVEERMRGSQAGRHLHFQVRKLIKVKKKTRGRKYIIGGNGLLIRDGWMYEIVDYNNGVNGCIDPAQFYANVSAQKHTFTHDLFMGVEGEDVRRLQQWLNNNGYRVALWGAGSKGRETAVFGTRTMDALRRFQVAKGISPAHGYFGEKSRAIINL